jgi:hypothetical protein
MPDRNHLSRSLLLLLGALALGACEPDAGRKACERYYEAIEPCYAAAERFLVPVACETAKDSEAEYFECLTDIAEITYDCSDPERFDAMLQAMARCML